MCFTELNVVKTAQLVLAIYECHFAVVMVWSSETHIIKEKIINVMI